MRFVFALLVGFSMLIVPVIAGAGDADRICVNKANVAVNTKRCLQQERESEAKPNLAPVYFWYEFNQKPAELPKFGLKLTGGKATPAVAKPSAPKTPGAPSAPTGVRIVAGN